MSDDSESVTTLADIPANCGMYTAQEVRDYVSGEFADFNSEFASGSGAVVAIGLVQWSLDHEIKPLLYQLSGAVDDRIIGMEEYPMTMHESGQVLALASGVSGLKDIYFNRCVASGDTSDQQWERVMFESDLESEPLVCGMTNIKFMQAIAKGVWCGISSGCRNLTETPEAGIGCAFDGYESGHVAYERLNDLISGGSFGATMERLSGILDLFDGSGDIAKAKTFMTNIVQPYSGGTFCQMVSGCVSGQFVEKTNLCEELSGAGCLSGYNAHLSALMDAIQTLSGSVSGLRCGIENMIDSLAESIVDTLTETASENPSEEVRAKAAAAKNNFDDQDIQAATILNAKKDVAGSITNDIIGGLTEVANDLDAPDTNDDVAGAASEVDGGGESAVEAQDSADDITKPGGVNDGLEGLADMLLGGAT